MTGDLGIGDDASIADAESSAPPRSSRSKDPIRGSSLLLLGRFISIGINFLVQVLIVRYLSQADYGAFAYALSLVSLGEMIVVFGLDRGVGRFLAIYDEERDYAKLFGTLALVAGTIASLGLALILLVVGLQGVIEGTIITDRVAVGILVILVVLAPIQALDNLLGSVLAVFASARSIFVRKYVVAPCLRLAVVGLLVVGQFGVAFLAVGYVVTGALGVAVYAGILWRVLGDRGVRSHLRPRSIDMPVRTLFAFTLPLLTTDLFFIAMNTMDAVFLGHFWGTEEVAAFRVIQPLAGLNTIVFASFTMLYLPAASRLFARRDEAGIGDLYWRTTVWIAILSFPAFALTTSLAQPVTVALYQERYADSSVYLVMLAIGQYFNAALGFNGLTLRVFGKIRYTVAISVAAATFNVVLNLALIPTYGALGAATATMLTLILHNILKQAGLAGTGIRVFDRTYTRVYVVIVAAVIGLWAIELTIDPPFVIAVAIAGVASLIVFMANRRLLDVAGAFPEVLRLPFVRRLLGV